MPGGSRPLRSFLEASCFSGLITDMAFEEDSPDTLSRFPLIALAEASTLSDDDIAKLRGYTENGGRLLLIGLCGEYAPDSRKRTPATLADAFGLQRAILPVDRDSQSFEGIFSYNGETVRLDLPLHSRYRFDAAGGVLNAGKTVFGVTQRVGKGELIWLLPSFGDYPLQPSKWFHRYLTSDPTPMSEPGILDALRATTGALLRAIVGVPTLTVACDSAELLASAFRVDGGYAIHLANLSDTLPNDVRALSHEDPLTRYNGMYKIPSPIHISLSGTSNVCAATLSSPESETSISIPFSFKHHRLELEIPSGIFGGYALLELTR